MQLRTKLILQNYIRMRLICTTNNNVTNLLIASIYIHDK